MNSGWIVVNVGCIECGVSSDIVGCFSDRDKAKDVAETLSGVMSWRQGGQNHFDVFPMPELDAVNDEYVTALREGAEGRS